MNNYQPLVHLRDSYKEVIIGENVYGYTTGRSEAEPSHKRKSKVDGMREGSPGLVSHGDPIRQIHGPVRPAAASENPALHGTDIASRIDLLE